MFIALPIFNMTLPGRQAPLDTWDYLGTLQPVYAQDQASYKI